MEKRDLDNTGRPSEVLPLFNAVSIENEGR